MNRGLLLLMLAAGGALYMLKQKGRPVPVGIPAGVSQRPEKEVSNAAKRAFINAVEKYAPEIEAKYGIKPVITIAQACLESTFGTSGLAREGKNLYGIKVSKAWAAANKPVWTGMTEEFEGGRSVLIKDKFKKYSSWKESIYDWAELISKTYKTAYGYAKRGDVAGFGNAIHTTGYSTHPQYVKLLVEKAAQIA